MPLHISEIGVRMAVRDPGDAPPAQGTGGSGCGASPSGAGTGAGMSGPQREALVEDCVRAVLRTLNLRAVR